ncbi:class I SAM-dependent methyltransferase [Paenibacillus sp. FSL R7-0204]|uniref:class I SAM-dependent DNA methyltransferase n=1 Tax=Paenibacillus sp. FSL R7-0204 TaxID=2921675 RepID=UPI0030F64EC1
MQQYGKWMANLYDNVDQWGGFSRKYTPALYSFFEQKGLKGSVLDLCAGTGTSALAFLKKGHQVVLVDRSPDMLNVARQKLYYYILKTRAVLIEADAAAFSVPGEMSFEFAYSLYDAMNHLEGLESLKSCFGNVYLSLKEGGFFVFDMNTSRGLLKSNKLNVYDSGDVFILEKGIYHPGMDSAYITIDGFQRQADGNYVRFEELIYNRVYAMNEIKKVLENTGFTRIYYATASDLNVPVADPEQEDRVYFVCQK